MKKEDLQKAFDMVQKIQKNEREIKDVLGIDVFETPSFTEFYNMFDLLICSHYTEEGQDWIFWWCYENDFGNNGLEAYDKDNLICRSFDELYEYVKRYEC